jgi:glycosyltransferase involved in cell wall biosynthesis
MNQLYINKPKISIILPCLNEEEAVKTCLDSLILVIHEQKLSAEVIIVDNGSIDRTIEYINDYLIKFNNIKLFIENKRGYGSALMKGFEHAEGDFFYMADCDTTYDFNQISDFINKLEEGYDMVIGNRFSGNMESNAMPFHKKHIGNPVLSFLTRSFFKIKIHDMHCGARAFKKDIYRKLSLNTTGMEFASEMIIKAAKKKFKITEIPIIYKKRLGDSKLNTFSDGWRHLRFLLLYSPLFLFFIPGIFLFITGTFLTGIFYFKNIEFLGLTLYFHPMFLFLTMTITGYQLIFFAMFSKIYAITHLKDTDTAFEKLFKIFTIEKIVLLGVAIALIGFLIFIYIFINWMQNDFGEINHIKNSIVALLFIVIGIQTFFSGFMLSTLGIKEK